MTGAASGPCGQKADFWFTRGIAVVRRQTGCLSNDELPDAVARLLGFQKTATPLRNLVLSLAVNGSDELQGLPRPVRKDRKGRRRRFPPPAHPELFSGHAVRAGQRWLHRLLGQGVRLVPEDRPKLAIVEPHSRRRRIPRRSLRSFRRESLCGARPPHRAKSRTWS